MATKVKFYNVKIGSAVAAIKGLEVSDNVIVVSEIIYNDEYKKQISLGKMPTLPFPLGTKVSVEDIQFLLTKNVLKFELEDATSSTASSEKRVLKISEEQSNAFQARIKNEEIERRKLTDLKFRQEYDEQTEKEKEKEKSRESIKQRLATSLSRLRSLHLERISLDAEVRELQSKYEKRYKDNGKQISLYLQIVEELPEDVKKDYPMEIIDEINSYDSGLDIEAKRTEAQTPYLGDKFVSGAEAGKAVIADEENVEETADENSTSEESSQE